jgi:hypothetical protein
LEVDHIEACVLHDPEGGGRTGITITNCDDDRNPANAQVKHRERVVVDPVKVVYEEHVRANGALDVRRYGNWIAGQPGAYRPPQRQIRHPTQRTEAAAFEKSPAGGGDGGPNQRRLADPRFADDGDGCVTAQRCNNRGLLGRPAD